MMRCPAEGLGGEKVETPLPLKPRHLHGELHRVANFECGPGRTEDPL